MPKLYDLTDYDPMGNVTSFAPAEASTPVSAPSGGSVLDRVLNRLLRDDDKRYQLWPEKVIREGITAAGDVYSKGALPPGLRREDFTDIPAPDAPTKDSTALGKFLNIAPVGWQPNDKIIEQAQAASALAGTGGLAGVGGDAGVALGSTPFLRPALKYKDRLYKGKDGQGHHDVIPDALYPEFQQMAMRGDDISHYNFGFVNDKGRFLSREDALKYGIDTGLIDPQAGKFGALTSTLLADSSKPGMAIEAVKGSAKAPTFYSALEHNVSKIAQDKMPGDQWLNTLANKPGVKPEELQWSGLNDFLLENKGKPVTKEQVKAFLDENKTELGEVVKGTSKPHQFGTPDEQSAAIKRHAEAREKLYDTPTDSNKYAAVEKEYKEARDAIRDVVPGWGRKADGDPTKYSQYQVPGGENYREVLLTLPNKDKGFDPALVKTKSSTSSTTQGMTELYYGDKLIGKFDDPPMLNPQTKKYEQRPEEYWKGVMERRYAGDKNLGIKATDEGKTYRSSHWDEPNVLAHMRMNDRTIDGKKSLHLEEVQSDWHQDGRKKGYKSEATTKEYDKLIEDKHNLAQKVVKLENEMKSEIGKGYDLRNLSEADRKLLTSKLNEAKANSPEFQEANKAYVSVADKVEQGNPYMGVPDAPFKKTWSDLALKRAIREASENGYDRLSWTAGEFHPTNPKNLKQTGKAAEAADKGMQGFYNDIVPKAIKKLTGQEVKTTKSDGVTMYYIDIPQSVRDTALGKGFPLYSSTHMFTPVAGNPFEDKK